MAEEKTFFQYEDVAVTNSRFMVESQTFAMSNITSVKTLRQSPNRLWPAVLVIVGFFLLFGEWWVAGLIFCGAGAAWGFMQKPMYHVMLTTAGGETSALSSKQPEYVEKVVRALNDAIVARG